MSRPNEWTRMHTSGGRLIMSVRVNDVDADLVFEKLDLRVLKNHLTVAIAQEESTRNGNRSSTTSSG